MSILGSLWSAAVISNIACIGVRMRRLSALRYCLSYSPSACRGRLVSTISTMTDVSTITCDGGFLAMSVAA